MEFNNFLCSVLQIPTSLYGPQGKKENIGFCTPCDSGDNVRPPLVPLIFDCPNRSMIGVELFLEQFSGKSEFGSARTDGNNETMLVKIKHKIMLFNI